MPNLADIPAPKLERFLEAQAPVYEDVLAELRQGNKQTHWMWFIFPQLVSFARSATAKKFGIVDLNEAREYLQHPVLGARLRECFRLVLTHPELAAEKMFGSIDAMKLRSCSTLFLQASGDDPLFQAVLTSFYGGEPDLITLNLLHS